MTVDLAVMDDAALLHRTRGDAQAVLLSAVRLGATTVRTVCYSSDIARDGWAPMDRLVEDCVAMGLAPQVTISGQPKWSAEAGEDDGSVPFTDPSPGAFAAFAAETVERYEGKGVRYSLVNEPNQGSFFATASTDDHALPDLYARLYRAGYEAVRQADPAAQILWGELSGGDGSQEFMKRAVVRGGIVADGMAIHPYQFQTHPIVNEAGGRLGLGQLPYLADWLRRTSRLRTPGGAPLPLYVTELGWMRRGPRAINEAMRARWAVDALRMCDQLDIRQMCLYQLTDSDAADPVSWDTGILGLDGKPSQTYKALRAAAATIDQGDPDA